MIQKDQAFLYPNLLCQACNSIPITTFTYGEPFKLFRAPEAFENLAASATRGCHLCKIFLMTLEAQQRIQPKNNSTRPGPPYRLGASHFDVLIWRQPLEIETGNLSVKIDMQIFPNSTHDKQAALIARAISFPERTLNMARSWLEECCREHGCRDVSVPDPPKRLLDVSNRKKIRLVLSSDLGPCPNYVALSHCWGQLQPVQTTRSTLKSHLKGILVSDLPLTFREAIHATRELGFRFIWIDSLCIVQHDKDEFESEVARMNTIYSQANLTIAATDAKDCTEGLFRHQQIGPLMLRYFISGSQSETTVVLRPVDLVNPLNQTEGPLQTRAWTFQERYLSPRILHFAKRGLLWECRRSTASELSNNPWWKESNSGLFVPGGSDFFGSRSSHPSENVDERWYQMVESYSDRVLSNPQDRLPAFSGIAAEWNKRIPGDRYLAGLWYSDLLSGLTWFPAAGVSDQRRPLPQSSEPWPPESPYKGIPSWSWASYNGRVTHYGKVWGWFDCYGERDVVQLVSASVAVQGKNPFGVVNDGQITLSGWSMAVKLSESDYWPGGVTPDRDSGPKAYVLKYNSHDEVMVYFDHDPYSLPEVELTLFQLGKGTAVTGLTGCSACGLVLRDNRDPSKSECFIRIGMFHIIGEDFWKISKIYKTYTII